MDASKAMLALRLRWRLLLPGSRPSPFVVRCFHSDHHPTLNLRTTMFPFLHADTEDHAQVMNLVLGKLTEILSTREKQRILITGATSGIGFRAAQILCGLGCDVSITARNHSKGEQAAREISTALPGSQVGYVAIDFDSFHSVYQGVDQLTQSFKSFDIVILNAGVMLPKNSITEDEIETTFQVNFLSQYFLVKQLLAARPTGHKMHIVCLSSILFKLFQGFPWSVPLDYAKFEKLFTKFDHSGWKQYSLSKLSMIFLAEYLKAQDGVTACAVNPGNARTSVTRNMKKKRFFKIFARTLIPVDTAALNVVVAALHTTDAGVYYHQMVQQPLPKRFCEPQHQHSLITLADNMLEGCAQRVERKASTPSHAAHA